VASAGAAELAPFAREWLGMRERIVIDSSGGGHFHYMGNCASCSMADMPYYTHADLGIQRYGQRECHRQFRSGSSGRRVGGGHADPPDTIQWAIGGKDGGLFCGSNPAYCGG
jgi:hypothetical protein